MSLRLRLLQHLKSRLGGAASLRPVLGGECFDFAPAPAVTLNIGLTPAASTVRRR